MGKHIEVECLADVIASVRVPLEDGQSKLHDLNERGATDGVESNQPQINYQIN